MLHLSGVTEITRTLQAIARDGNRISTTCRYKTRISNSVGNPAHTASDGGSRPGWSTGTWRRRALHCRVRRCRSRTRGTSATLGLALSRIVGQAPAAAGLLRLLAFLAPEPAR